MKLLVLTPSYKSKELLRCVESAYSVLSDVKDLDYLHVIMEDGTDKQFVDDNYPLESFPPNTSFIYDSVNLGVSDRRNKLLEYAHEYNPDFITWLDSDDELMPDFVDSFNYTDDYDVICGRIYRNYMGHWSVSGPTNGLWTVNRDKVVKKGSAMPIILMAKLYRWSAIKMIKFPPNMRIMEDYAYSGALPRNLRSIDIRLQVYKKHILGGTGSNKKIKVDIDAWNMYNIEMKRIRNQHGLE